MRHISKDIGDRKSAVLFFGRSPISQHAVVWDAIFVLNQCCRLLRRLLRRLLHCDLALASPIACVECGTAAAVQKGPFSWQCSSYGVHLCSVCKTVCVHTMVSKTETALSARTANPAPACNLTSTILSFHESFHVLAS